MYKDVNVDLSDKCSSYIYQLPDVHCVLQSLDIIITH